MEASGGRCRGRWSHKNCSKPTLERKAEISVSFGKGIRIEIGREGLKWRKYSRDVVSRCCIESVEEIINKRTAVAAGERPWEEWMMREIDGFKISRGIRGVYGIVRVQVHGTFGIFD